MNSEYLELINLEILFHWNTSLRDLPQFYNISSHFSSERIRYSQKKNWQSLRAPLYSIFISDLHVQIMFKRFSAPDLGN